MSIEKAIFGKIIDFGLDAAGNLLGGGGDGGGNDPLLTALRMQRYAQAGKYISSVRVPEKPGTPPVTNERLKEPFLISSFVSKREKFKKTTSLIFVPASVKSPD